MSFCEEVKSEILNKINDKYINEYNFGEKLTVNNLNNLNTLNISNLNEEKISHILMGIFSSSGYITDPNKEYHLEVLFQFKNCCNYYIKILSILDFTPKLLKRNNKYVVYIKESDMISRFLSIIKCSNGLIKFEEIRVIKDVANNINRTINCETSNQNKSIIYSQKIIDKINKLKENNKIDDLDFKLKEVINFKIENPYLSLDSLSKLIGISKSGLKHRLDKIMEIEI
ncbi:MAG: DNA-binding protein WhiA [Clostridia bacterium]